VLQGRSRAVKETMGWYGKLIGAVLGALVGRGLLGAIVGFIIGHLFDRASTAGTRPGSSRGAASPSPSPPSPDLQQAFFRGTFQVMGHVAKVDGHVTEQEIDAARAAMRRFSLGEADIQRAIGFYTEGKAADFPLEDVLGAFRAATSGREDLRRLFVQIQLEAALQGAGLSARSRAVLGRVCDALGISAIEFAALEAMLRMRGPTAAGEERGAAEELADAYQALGVAPEATDAEVTLAYRRLMSQNHPDKLVANGLPQSMIEAAHERTRRLIAAYELLRKHRGMK